MSDVEWALLGAAIGLAVECVRANIQLERLRSERNSQAKRNEEARQWASQQNQQWQPPRVPLTPQPARSLCGMAGCPLRKPHSHVVDLCARIKQGGKR